MYDLLPNEDETMIADSVREFLAAELPIERLRPDARAIDHAAVWQGIARLGWFGAGLPETCGGSEQGLTTEILIQRECGASLASPGIMATVLAGHVAHKAGDNAAASRFASGETMASLAIDTAPGGDDSNRDILIIDCAPESPVLFWDESGMGLFPASAMADITPADPIDDSVTLHAAHLDRADSSHWVPAAKAALPARADILLAAAMCGLATRACELAVEYAKVREQFGKPIGSFQAIKHRCADMAVRHRLAWYQTCLAALKLEHGAEDAGMHVASAKLLAAEAAHQNGRAGIQIHGAIGFQAECDAHWLAKRAFIYDQAGGAMAVQAAKVIA